jgi:hypothetical protein
MRTDPQPDLVTTMRALQAALGDNNLAKQVFSDANASDRQTRQNHFDARTEYVRQMAERTQATEASIKEYGLQTLKWLFLLNAGAIAVVMAYVGGKGADARAIGSIAIAAAPFMFGCICVVVAGAFGFFNFNQRLRLPAFAREFASLFSVQTTGSGRAHACKIKRKTLTSSTNGSVRK